MGPDVAASNKTESDMSLSPELIKKLQAAGMKLSAIQTDAADAFEPAEFIEATLPKWIADQKEKRPHCFIGAGQIDMESVRFRRRQHDGAHAPNQTSWAKTKRKPARRNGD